MSDFLLENQLARNAIKTLGLPLPVPPVLGRAKKAMEERPLKDHAVVVGGAGACPLAPAIARTLIIAGADPRLVAERLAPAFAELGEAYGRPAHPLDLSHLDEKARFEALVFDASEIADADGLRALYDFFHPLVRSVVKCGRVVVLGRPAESTDSPEAASAQAALEGFVRSLGKELGKKGSTAQLLRVAPGAEDRVDGPLRYFLSNRSAFISGQPIDVNARAKDDAAPRWSRPLDGKVALVTGAARGIGAATAKLLAEEGAHVVCLDRPGDDGPLSRVAHEVGGTPLLIDVTDGDAPAEIDQHLASVHGGVDIVIHNAGVTRDKTLARMKPEQWDLTLQINLAAIARINRALIGGALHDGGRVILLSSIAGIAGNVGQTNYAASKAGVIGYTRALAEQLADRGITVNAIAPGFIETRLTAAIPVMIREAGRRLASLGQGGLPRDVGDAITFLATPGASGLTGGVLRVCGGGFIGA